MRLSRARGGRAPRTAPREEIEKRLDALLRQQDETAINRIRDDARRRSDEHTSELQSLLRNSYAVFCLKKEKALIIGAIAHSKRTPPQTTRVQNPQHITTTSL